MPLVSVRNARVYFGVQATAGLGWWILVFTVPAVREATLGELPALVIAAFDVPLFVVAAALAALAYRPAVWVATVWTIIVAVGMFLYATATSLAGWGTLCMIAASVGSIGAALVLLTGRIPVERLLVGPFRFQKTRAPQTRRIFAATALQIVAFWGLFLGVLPPIIRWFERRWQLTLELPPWMNIGGVALFILASTLGLWSAFSMVTRGRGTPLPSAHATKLVVRGPYRFVRNPMAVAGIAQGVGVGLVLGSWLVVAYALCGSLVWNWAIRPAEEADLEARFGAAFTRYRDRVGCWVPTLSR